MGSARSVQKTKSAQNTESSLSNKKQNQSNKNDSNYEIPALPSKLFDMKLIQEQMNVTQKTTFDKNEWQAQDKKQIVDKEKEDDEDIERKREEWIQVIKSSSLEYLIHMIENKEIGKDEVIDIKTNSNIYHLICKYNKHRLLKYMIFYLSEISYESFNETLYDLVTFDKQNILDLSIQYNSIDCLKILFKVGGFSLDKKYQKYISLALSYNSQHALEYIQDKTRNGTILNFMKINYSYINRFSNNYFKVFLQQQNQHLLNKTIDPSLFTTYNFIDPTFLHIPQNVYGINANKDNLKEKQIIWLRPEQVCKFQRSDDLYFQDKKQPILFEKISPSNIIQGESMNCYFLAVLQSLSMNPKLVQDTFNMNLSRPDIGLYCCRFYSRGEVENIIIDDYLPCYAENKQLIYSKFYRNSIWVSLLEKAWAKMQGSYIDTEQLLIEDAMECILPYPTEGFWIKDLTSEELIDILQSGIKNNYLIVVTTKNNLKDEEISLIKNHAYSLLSLYIHKGEKIIKLKNPWGKNEWQGKLQTSTSQKIIEMKKSLEKSTFY